VKSIIFPRTTDGGREKSLTGDGEKIQHAGEKNDSMKQARDHHDEKAFDEQLAQRGFGEDEHGDGEHGGESGFNHRAGHGTDSIQCALLRT